MPSTHSTQRKKPETWYESVIRGNVVQIVYLCHRVPRSGKVNQARLRLRGVAGHTQAAIGGATPGIHLPRVMARNNVRNE